MTPTDQQLTQMFQHVWPAPGARLGHKLARAPWTQHAVTHGRLLTALAVLLLGLVLALSPQGQAAAQSLFQYFVPAPATAFVLPPQPEATLPPTVTPISEAIPSPLPTGFRRYRDIDLAQGMVDYHIYRLPEVPSGFLFRDIGVHHDNGYVVTRYDAADGGGHLWIFQSNGPLPSSAWMQVPADAIEKVSIGSLQGEYVQGFFVVYPNSTTAVWEPTSPTFRLRWQNGDTHFSIEKSGNMPVMEWLDKEAMIMFALALMASQ